MMNTARTRTRLLTASAMGLASASLLPAAPAWARCVTTAANTAVCDATTPNPDTAQQNAGTITVDPGAAIASASNPAVTETGTVIAITNSGTISSTAAGGRAINVSGANNARTITLVNNAGATITSQDDAFRVNINPTGGSIRVDNFGTIQTTAGGQALDFDSAGSGAASIVINNYAGASLRSFGQDGIRPGQGAVVTNAGTIYADGAANNNYDGIDFQANGGTVNNQAGGLISGLRHGITSDAGVTVTNGGTIQGRNGSGVGSDGTGTVTNTGTITGAWDGVATNGDGDGVDIDLVATIVNSGTIQGLSARGVDSGGRPNSAEGIAIGGGSVTNSGTVFGAGNAILVNLDTNPGGAAVAATTITNSGLIRGGTGYAVQLVGGFDDGITNSGTITGGTLGAIDMGGGNDTLVNTGSITGAVNMGDGNDTLTNAGTITGNVSLGAGDDTLTLLPGSVIAGTLDGGAGTDVVTLGGTGAGNFAGGFNLERLDVAGGTWTLGGNATVPALTTVAPTATLVGTTANLTGALVDRGTVRIEQSFDGTFTANLTSTGALIKAGTGSVTIGALPGFSGATNLLAGQLVILGSVGSPVTVSGGTLAGTGSVGSVSLLSGATISPGVNGVGTLTIAGNLVQAAGSSYAATINGATSDLLRVGGSATIGTGAQLVVTGSTGTAPIGTRYTLITAAGGITGSYTLVQPTAGATELRAGQNAGAYYVDLVRSASGLSSFAVTGNQTAVVGAFSRLGAANAAYAALTATAADAAVAPALDLLSGEIHASLRTAAVRDVELVQQAVLSRAREHTTGIGIWGQFVANSGQDDGARALGIAKQQRDTLGGAGGIDAAVGGAETIGHIGIAGGYTHDDVDLDARASSARLEGKHVLAYAGGAFRGALVSAALGYTWLDSKTRRAVSFDGFGDTLRADYHSHIVHAVAELGYAIPLGGGTFEPFVSGAAYRISSEAFDERGGAAALHGEATHQSFVTSYVGARVATPIVDGLMVRGSGAWRHGFDDHRYGIATLSFANAALPFNVTGAPLSRDAATASLEMVWAPSDRIRVAGGYEGVIGNQTVDNGAKVSMSFGF
ncbi:autotransporter domain-containing protein [Sphingomonas sp. CD22]|uniref:autotransporter outer membrane beta-barrel domain-containing protein n=1 Tax=Sphingomonas sp. CD22 TaxID=3100214 RepID=UPI002AE078B0|nr:autotransporter domain-containing protein [Sphingomonas sp. CD22]MEA1084422.1 autotransporter domain-containing protein [Sphingomonas sp. CD22]